jgi:hypothetical protein
MTSLLVNQCETLLLQLSYSDHRIDVHFHSGNEVLISMVAATVAQQSATSNILIATQRIVT